MIDLMAGLLSGGGFGSDVRPLYGDYTQTYDCSHLLIAIDLAHFGDPDELRRLAAGSAEKLRRGRRAPGVDRLYAPGEPERSRRQLADGRVDLQTVVARMLRGLADQFGVPAGALSSNLP